MDRRAFLVSAAIALLSIAALSVALDSVAALELHACGLERVAELKSIERRTVNVDVLLERLLAGDLERIVGKALDGLEDPEHLRTRLANAARVDLGTIERRCPDLMEGIEIGLAGVELYERRELPESARARYSELPAAALCACAHLEYVYDAPGLELERDSEVCACVPVRYSALRTFARALRRALSRGLEVEDCDIAAAIEELLESLSPRDLSPSYELQCEPVEGGESLYACTLEVVVTDLACVRSGGDHCTARLDPLHFYARAGCED